MLRTSGRSAHMSAKRRRSPASMSTVPRNIFPGGHHKDIDAILRDLKLCSRRLKVALDNFNDELRLLERLYYKCKNQHRMALFFKRVPEMRRYGRRLSEVDIADRIDLLRASFVGLEDTTDQKALRGSWSHVPEPPYVYFLLERLTACSTLVHKMRERLENSYRHFSLAMQTGAFVQLIILFVAISSRMSMLSSDLEEALQLSIATCNRLLRIIHPTGTCVTSSQQLSLGLGLETTDPSESHIGHDVLLEDMGRVVSHHEPIETIPRVEDLSTKVEVTLETRVTPSSHPTTADDYAAVLTLKKKKAIQKYRGNKAKKKPDEIDEIFGF